MGAPCIRKGEEVREELRLLAAVRADERVLLLLEVEVCALALKQERPKPYSIHFGFRIGYSRLMSIW